MPLPPEIEAAAHRIAPYVRRTPVIALEPGVLGVAGDLHLKLELLQHSGSFKARGAFNRLLTAETPAAGVIAASGGNHGAAVAYAARRLGYRAEIFVPDVCPEIKVRRLKHYGAIVTQVGAVYTEALAASQARAAETGALPIHAFDDRAVMAGQGTVAREFIEQVPGMDTVLIAVGGGGLIGGVASWFRGDVRVVGVEPVRAATLARALEAGAPVDVAVGGLAVDSLGATRAGALAFAAAQQFVERVVLVEDSQISAAQKMLWEDLRIAAEPGGATALAALLSGSYRP
ncbi:MAG: threonine/serine dehydratase, partial [Chloroflexi bacterium]|nr:threonine/serine dehydratase [Chloroflexota bacterium]